MVVGNSAYAGVLSKDLTIDFYYDSIEKSMPSLMSTEPTVSVTFDFGGTSVAVDASKITMTDRNGGTQFLVEFNPELIDGIAVDEDLFRGKYDYDGNKWTFASAVMTKNGREVSEFYGDIFTNGKVLNEGDIFDVVFHFTEVQTSVTKPVSIDKDFGCYLSEDGFVGTFKGIHLYVDSTKYDLTADTPTDINFEEDSTVKVVIEDDETIWSGNCKLFGGVPSFTRSTSSYYCELGVEAASGVKLFNDFVFGFLGDGGTAGGSGGHGAAYYKHTYYDLTAKTVENDPISGISITDIDVQGFEGWSHSEAGLLSPLTSGELVNGVKDWTVSADYEASTATFHIVATKAGKADVSVYDVYGATYENGVVDTSEAVTIPRYEKSYAEPNKMVSVDSKGVTEYDSKEYQPLASSWCSYLSFQVKDGVYEEKVFDIGIGSIVHY